MAEKKNFLESLCNLEVPIAIEFSHDGQQVLYQTSLQWGHMKDGVPLSNLWLAESNVRKSAKKLSLGQHNNHAPAWNPDGRSIAFLSDRAGTHQKWAIYSLSLKEGSEPAPVTPLENKQFITKFVFSPDGKSIAYLSPDEADPEAESGLKPMVWGEKWSYARLRIVDVGTKQIRSLNVERNIVDLCWSPEGDKIGIVSSETADGEDRYLNGTKISIVDIRSMAVLKDVCSLPSDATSLLWAADGKLYFRAGVPVNKLFSDYGVYMADPISATEQYQLISFGVNENLKALKNVRGTPVAWVESRMHSRICRLDGTDLWAAKSDVQSFITCPFDVHFDGKASAVAVATSDINHPVEVFISRSQDEGLYQLSKHGAEFEGFQAGACNFLTFASSDGEVELDALYLTPFSATGSTVPSLPPKPLPTVVLVHGGPVTRITEAFDAYYYMWAPYLLSLGYGILLPNYRGSSGRGQRFASYSANGTGKLDYADIIAATQYAVSSGFADKERLVVGGYSHGGYLAFCAAVRNGMHGLGWKFQAAIVGAGIADLDSMALTSDNGGIYIPELCNGRVIWNMDQHDTRNREGSPIWEIDSAFKESQRIGEMVIPPILILHGENDQRCPASQAQGMRRALLSKKLPFQLVMYPGQRHMMHEQKFWIDMGLRVANWCEKHIGPRDAGGHKMSVRPKEE